MSQPATSQRPQGRALPTEPSNSQLAWIDEEFDSTMNDTRVIFDGLTDVVKEGESNETPDWQQRVKERMAKTREKLNTALDSLESKVTEGIKKLPKQEQDKAGAIFSNLLDTFETVLDTIKKAITVVWNWVKDTASRVWSTVKAIWSTVAALFS